MLYAERAHHWGSHWLLRHLDWAPADAPSAPGM